MFCLTTHEVHILVKIKVGSELGGKFMLRGSRAPSNGPIPQSVELDTGCVCVMGMCAHTVSACTVGVVWVCVCLYGGYGVSGCVSLWWVWYV